jgi:type 1 glutamine amidotransferase
MIFRFVSFAALIFVLFSYSAAASGTSARAEKLRVLIITGQNNHNWKQTTPHLKQFLEASGRFTADVTEDPATFMAKPDSLKPYDVLLLNYNGPRWGEAAEKNFLEAVRAGKGVSVIHAANNAFPGWLDYEKLVAITWRSTAGHGPYHEFPVRFVVKDHPITKGLPDMQNHPDELYHRLTPAPGEPFNVIGVAFSDAGKGGTGNDEPMVLVKTFGNGKVFHTALGHDIRSMKDPAFMLLVARGTEWAGTGKVTVDKAPVVP